MSDHAPSFPGFLTFQNAEAFQKFVSEEQRELERNRKNFDAKVFEREWGDYFKDREMTPDEKEKYQEDMKRYGEFYSWLNNNRPKYDNHDFRPGFNVFVNFFMEAAHSYEFDLLTVTGTYTISTPSPEQPMILPRLLMKKGNLTVDIVYDFGGIGCIYLLRLHELYEPSETELLFLNTSYAPSAETYSHFPDLDGEQTILSIDHEYNLHAILCLLFGKVPDW